MDGNAVVVERISFYELFSVWAWFSSVKGFYRGSWGILVRNVPKFVKGRVMMMMMLCMLAGSHEHHYCT